jgi:hypothetical protein
VDASADVLEVMLTSVINSFFESLLCADVLSIIELEVVSNHNVKVLKGYYLIIQSGLPISIL